MNLGDELLYFYGPVFFLFFPGVAMVKNPPANAGDTKDVGLIPRSERSPEVGNGNPLQYSCLEDSMDRQQPGRLQSIGLQRVGHD